MRVEQTPILPRPRRGGDDDEAPRQFFPRLLEAMELLFRRHAAVINGNEGRPVVIDSGSLPTASSEWHTRTAVVLNAGVSDDTFHICIQETGGTYAWKTVTVT